MKPLVYVSSPYTKGDVGINTRFQCDVFDKLVKEGLVTPITPLWSHLQHLVHPLPYQTWMRHDLELVARVDAIIRLNVEMPSFQYYMSESVGADLEVQHARSLNIPVFYSIESLYQWARTLRTDADQ